MAACSGGDLELKWAAERNALRNECHIELRHKLLDIAQAQLISLNEDRKTLHELLEDKTLLDLKQKLDAIALSGRRLSQVFMNSLVAMFIHRIAAASSTQSRKKTKQGLVTEETGATQNNDADFHPTSGCNLAAISSAPASGVTPQVPTCFWDIHSCYSPLSHMVDYECARAKVEGNAGFILEGFLVDRVLKEPLQDDTRGCSARTQLARLVQERVDLVRQISEERNLLAKRSAYLRDCRAAAEKEKEMARRELAAAMLSLVMAEKERVAAANCRTDALDELKHTTSLREYNQPQFIYGSSLGLQDVEVPQKALGYTAPTAWAGALQLNLHTAPRLSLPLPTCPAIPTLTPPDSPNDTESSRNSGDSCSVPAAISSGNPTCSKVEKEADGNDDRQGSVVVSQSVGIKDEMETISAAFENPIGPYIRPPMPLEDMLKCVRCLFGKDKSLKTGNRARAFLGVPWSEIVSFDPDVLLGRGVLGIKEGSTGMASRLRMMTIIESALANQNDDTIPAEVWERPTHFCENCQKRYPISVNSNEAVLPFEESVQREIDASASQVLVEGDPRSQEASGSNLKGKRNRKRLRGTRAATHPPR